MNTDGLFSKFVIIEGVSKSIYLCDDGVGGSEIKCKC